MDDALTQALETLARHAERLSGDRHFEWPAVIRQAVHRLRLAAGNESLPSFVAIVGGASSGKSTVFNNLLGGHRASHITARGHATLGPILAVHEHHRTLIDKLLADERFLPGFAPVVVELDGNVTGSPDAVQILFHSIETLRDMLLFDLPDFTSQSAHNEGCVALSLLPWFDRLIIVVDHERWFDRQSISQLRAESARFAQHRWVLFNRTQEGHLTEESRTALEQQASRMAVKGMGILEFRRGRGFREFPPNTLDDTQAFLEQENEPRTGALLTQVSDAANRVLSQNEERSARLKELRVALAAASTRTLPTVRECMASLMTPTERKQIEFVSRVLRLHETRDWLTAQSQRIRSALERVPGIGALVGLGSRKPEPTTPAEIDRTAIASDCYQTVVRRQVHEIQRTVQVSAFWDEIRRWTGGQPSTREFRLREQDRERIRNAATQFDTTLKAWLARVNAECAGTSPHVVGAIGAGTLGLAVVLIALPGPVAAITLASAQGAIGAALTKLAVATGAGALAGKPIGRLVAVVQDKLLASPELDQVRKATAAFHALLESAGTEAVDEAIAEASKLVLRRDGDDAELLRALERLSRLPEVTS